MENNKIIIKVPNELKKDLSNTKALDWEENESFFQWVDLRDEKLLKFYFNSYKILFFTILWKIHNPLNIFEIKQLKNELKEIKFKIKQLEKVYDEIYWYSSFKEKEYFSLVWNNKKNYFLNWLFIDLHNLLIRKIILSFNLLDKKEDEYSTIIIVLYKWLLLIISLFLIKFNFYLCDKDKLNQLKQYLNHLSLSQLKRAEYDTMRFKKRDKELYEKLFY